MKKQHTSTNPKILFRADSGLYVGNGHRTRIESIAKEVGKLGIDYRIVSRSNVGAREDPNDVYPTLWLSDRIELNYNDIESEQDALETLDVIKQGNFNPDIIIIDSYFLGFTWEEKIRQHGFYIVAIDDYKNRLHRADLVFELLPPPCSDNRICGIDIIPVDKQFSKRKNIFPNIGWKLLISFGGLDPTMHTQKSLMAIEEIDSKIPGFISSVDIVLGSSFQDISSIINRYSSRPNRIFHQKLSSLAPLMKKCHVILTSGGNTMIESVVAKMPSIIIVTSDNQQITADYLAEKQLVYLLGTASQIDVQEIINGILSLSTKLQQGMLQALTNSQLDSFGAQRFVSKLLSHWNNIIT